MPDTARPARLWGDREFVKLWAGETVSLFGSHITATAVPLTAAVALNATPAQMGLLSAAQYAPFLLVTLLAGIWVDRRRRRPVLVVSNFARAVLIGLIPLAAVFGVLRMELLIVVVFLAGIFTVFFHLAYLSYLPVLIPPEHLVEGNSKLEVSSSTASIAGPGLAGFLVQVASGPIALAVDALSFVFAGICMMRIRRPEPAPAPTTQATPAQLWA
ncbi:MAG TPA: MFS transporter, partial [Longimicrobium sp.]|nr:MFS transporter [Longimicrobium sp.]